MSRRGYQKRGQAGKSQTRRGGQRRRTAAKLADVQLPLCREELVDLMQDSLARDGPADRDEARMSLVLLKRWVAPTIAGQKVAVKKPRVRYTGDCGEAELERYTPLQSPDALPQAALEHLTNGVCGPTHRRCSCWKAPRRPRRRSRGWPRA